MLDCYRMVWNYVFVDTNSFEAEVIPTVQINMMVFITLSSGNNLARIIHWLLTKLMFINLPSDTWNRHGSVTAVTNLCWCPSSWRCLLIYINHWVPPQSPTNRNRVNINSNTITTPLFLRNALIGHSLMTFCKYVTPAAGNANFRFMPVHFFYSPTCIHNFVIENRCVTKAKHVLATF